MTNETDYDTPNSESVKTIGGGSITDEWVQHVMKILDIPARTDKISDVVEQHHNWFRDVHGLVVLGRRKFLDIETMQVIDLRSNKK